MEESARAIRACAWCGQREAGFPRSELRYRVVQKHFDNGAERSAGALTALGDWGKRGASNEQADLSRPELT